MSDPWLPPAHRPLVPASPPTYAPYGPPNSPYGHPPVPVRRRRTGLVVHAVAGVLLLVATAAVLAVFVGSAAVKKAGERPADSSVKIYGPTGSAFSIVLPRGFRQHKDSDLRGGYLSATADGEYPPYLDIFADSRTQSEERDLVGVAHRLQEDNRDHGAKILAEIQNVTVNGLLVAQWEESYSESDKAGAHSQLTGVVLVGDKGEYLEIIYSNDTDTYSAAEAERVVAAILASLRQPE